MRNERHGNLDTLHVIVATPLGAGGRGGIDRLMDEVRAELKRSAMSRLNVSFLPSRGKLHLALAPITFAKLCLKLMYRSAWGQADVLHVNLASYGSTFRKIILCRLSSALRVPYVVHLHGACFREFWEGVGDRQARAIARMFSGASRILVLGDVWRDFIVTRIPTVSDRVEVLPNGSSARSSLPKRLPGRSVTILFLGEVCARKGVPQLVEALARLDDVSGWRAVLAGDGELQETVKSVTSLGMGKRISVLGWVGALEVQSLLSQADILVLPSFDENLPMAVVEAFAHGLAVVATPAGATGEIVIHGETGLLVHAGDVTGLAASLRRLLLDRDLRARLGQAALEFHGTNLEIGQYVKRLHRVWRDVAQLSEKYAKPRV